LQDYDKYVIVKSKIFFDIFTSFCKEAVMFRSYFLSWKWAPLAYGGAILIIVLLVLNTFLFWRFAEWLGEVGKVMAGYAQYTMPQFIHKYIYEALKIAGMSIAIGTLINCVSRVYCWFWFEALVCYFLPNWNKTLRDISNPSERLHNSADDFTQKFLNMSKAAVGAIIIVATGWEKLYDASANFSFDFGFVSFHNIPGLLFYVVFAICALGLLITRIIGKNLKKCRDDIRTATGSFRSCLEYIQRNKNEEDSIPAVHKSLKKLRKEMLRLFLNQFFVEAWFGIYGQFWAVVPILFFGFNVFSKHVDYGTANKTQGILNQLQSAFSTPIWFWDEYANFMSTVKRLRELEETIDNPENWKESVKEKGWEDRRRKIVTIDATGKTIELSREDIEKILANFDNLPDKTN